MTKREGIYVFGASGLGMETAYMIDTVTEFEVLAFLESPEYFTAGNPKEKSVNRKIVPVFEESEIAADKNEKGKAAAIAISSGRITEKIYKSYSDTFYFPNLIHPSAKLFGVKIMGKGNLMFADCWLSVDAQIGSFNKFLPFVTVGHGCRIGDYNEFNPKASVSGDIVIGKRNLFGTNCSLYQGITIGDDNKISLGSSLYNSIEDSGSYIGNPARLFM